MPRAMPSPFSYYFIGYLSAMHRDISISFPWLLKGVGNGRCLTIFWLNATGSILFFIVAHLVESNDNLQSIFVSNWLGDVSCDMIHGKL